MTTALAAPAPSVPGRSLRILAARLRAWQDPAIAALAVAGIAVWLILHYALQAEFENLPLYAVLGLGGIPLVVDLIAQAWRREVGADLLAGISIVASMVLGAWLAGAIVVLMLAGGATLERYAVRRASSVLEALARRMPSVAHRRVDAQIADVALDAVAPDDTLVVFPHESCPVDGVVVEGRGTMDESYLTGEPYLMSKAPGSTVLSGSINGDTALVIRATRKAVDSRYARITEVMRESEQNRPRLRRLGDQLGAVYTPITLAVAGVAWWVSGDAMRFLAVLVVATPCPLLIAIPVAIIASVSLAARHSIIIKNPAVLEQIDHCRTIILDKTGTLTYGAPRLTEQIPAAGFDARDVLCRAASLERYSKHPLSAPILIAARGAELAMEEAGDLNETPGQGLTGLVGSHRVRIAGRHSLDPAVEALLPPPAGGLECVVLIDGAYAATYRFHDAAREDSRPFIQHLGPRHQIDRVLLVSGDRESEVRYLARRVGIHEVFAAQSPENKVAIVREETKRAPTLFLGDGINDAPALTAATVGVAFGQNSDITTEAAGAVIMDSSLRSVDRFFHISIRLRRIALQSAVGGMLLSLVGMGFATAGLLSPVAGAIAQEVIDLAAILNALRVALPIGRLSDFGAEG